MLLIVGSLVVVACVFSGYAAMGGHLFVLWQPFEAVIICGAALGAYIIGNSKTVLASTGKAMGQVMKGSRYKKAQFVNRMRHLVTAAARQARSLAPGARPTRWNQLR